MDFISYAQNYEDVMLWRALGHIRSGYYIDVGANDPVSDSVTKAFYDVGWRGINIEPVTEWFNKLQKERPGDINLNLACGSRKEQKDFYEVMGTGLSTMDKLIADKHANEHGFEIIKHKVEVDRLTNICNQYANQDIHFLKIDVEGFELKVLKGLDLKKIRPWIILVESTLPSSQQQNHKEWESILINRQYHFVYFDGLNRFYIDNKCSNLDKYFDSPPNVFDGFVLSGMGSSSSHQQASQVKKITTDLSAAKQKILSQDKAISLVNNELSAAKQKVAEKDGVITSITTDLSAAKQKIDVLNQHSHHWWLESERLNKELQALYDSTSWRITWPLRKLMHFLKWLFYIPVHMAFWLISMPKRAVRSLLVKLIYFVLNRPVLNTSIRHFLIKYPRIYKKIQLLYRAHKLKPETLKELHLIQKDLEKVINIQTPIQDAKQNQSVKKWKLGKRIDV